MMIRSSSKVAKSVAANVSIRSLTTSSMAAAAASKKSSFSKPAVNASPSAEQFQAKFGFVPGKDKKLFTPGPLGVSLSTKQSMLRDLGSRDVAFITAVREIRSSLLKLGKVDEKSFTTVPVQGSGTFAVEAVIQTMVPRVGGLFLIISNGAYGQRMAKISEYLGIAHIHLEFPENQKANLDTIAKELAAHPGITNVAVVHSETSSGIINPIKEIGHLVKERLPTAIYCVDAMSSFGGIPIDIEDSKIDFLVSSANKCIEGVPGFSYAIARRAILDKCKGNSRSLSLDLYDQNASLDKSGQFRFTPATHSMLAFAQAMKELEQEGGVEGRAARYQENRRVLREGMSKLGFKELLDSSHEGYIITSFHYPKHENFKFDEFYSRLNEKGYVIYPGKVTRADCFRIGSIGHLFPSDMKELLVGIEKTLAEMKIPTPLQ